MTIQLRGIPTPVVSLSLSLSLSLCGSWEEASASGSSPSESRGAGGRPVRARRSAGSAVRGESAFRERPVSRGEDASRRQGAPEEGAGPVASAGFKASCRQAREYGSSAEGAWTASVVSVSCPRIGRTGGRPVRARRSAGSAVRGESAFRERPVSRGEDASRRQGAPEERAGAVASAARFKASSGCATKPASSASASPDGEMGASTLSPQKGRE